jgi:hypothetical protein
VGQINGKWKMEDGRWRMGGSLRGFVFGADKPIIETAKCAKKKTQRSEKHPSISPHRCLIAETN